MENQNNETFYQVLDVLESATLADIRTAYLHNAKIYHPDRVKDPTKLGESKQRFKSILEAYNILSNPITRAKYDQVLSMRRGRNIHEEVSVRDFIDREYPCSRCGEFFILDEMDEQILDAGAEIVLECSSCSISVIVNGEQDSEHILANSSDSD